MGKKELTLLERIEAVYGKITAFDGRLAFGRTACRTMLGMSPVDYERMLAMSAIACPFSKHQSAGVEVLL